MPASSGGITTAEAMRETGKPCYVYYVSDFDPSGWQMARNLEEKAIEQHIDHGHLEALRREEGAAREALQELAQAKPV
jgi:hypothetical protein